MKTVKNVAIVPALSRRRRLYLRVMKVKVCAEKIPRAIIVLTHGVAMKNYLCFDAHRQVLPVVLVVVLEEVPQVEGALEEVGNLNYKKGKN